MIDQLIELDQTLTLIINSWHTYVLDFIFYWISYKYTWIPFYGWLIWLIVKEYKRSAIWAILGIALLITITDQSAYHLFKQNFQRFRPCHHLILKESIHLVKGHCGGLYGFVSSHAANSFALATYICLIMNKKILQTIIIIWALLVAFSRVYLGVHYVADVIGGIVLGGLIAFCIAFVVKRMLTFDYQKTR